MFKLHFLEEKSVDIMENLLASSMQIVIVFWIQGMFNMFIVDFKKLCFFFLSSAYL